MQILQTLKKNFKEITKTAIFVLYILITQGWQALGVIIIAIFNNRPWECLFIFIGFIIGRHFFGKTYHAPTMFICTILTWIVFYFLTSSVPSFSISITIPCIFGISLSYILSMIAEYIERMDKYGK
ncbi:MAG: accessory gene regulator B family protein [Candidatus Odinarchaeota archaeon]